MFQGTVSGGSAAALMSIKKGPKESIGLCLMKVFGDSCKGGSVARTEARVEQTEQRTRGKGVGEGAVYLKSSVTCLAAKGRRGIGIREGFVKMGGVRHFKC